MDRKPRPSRSTPLENSNEELKLWKQICASLADLENVQNAVSEIMIHINKMHSINMDDGISSSMAEQLKSNYLNAMELTTKESRIIKDSCEKISVLMALREASQNVIDPGRKRRRPNDTKPTEPTSNGTSSKKIKTHHIIPQGTSVAAKQPKQKDKNEEWILAIVVNYQADKNKYYVEDVEQDEHGRKQRYLVPPRNVIAVVSDASEIVEELPAGKDVLALYPGTTCFYKAKVILPPSKNMDMSFAGHYKVQFEDDNNEMKPVTPEYVLDLPKGK